MLTLFFNILITLIIAAAALVLIISIVFIAALFVPIILDVDSSKGILILTFPGGRAELARVGGIIGIEYYFLWKKNFKSIREMFCSREKKRGKDEESDKDSIGDSKDKTGKPEEQKQGRGKATKKKDLNFYLNALKREEALIKRILKTFLLFLWDTFRLVEIRRVQGTFSLPDPYLNGLCCAVLAPLTRRNFSLIPNFDGKFCLSARILIMPSKVVWRILKLLFSLPVIRIYKLYRRLT